MVRSSPSLAGVIRKRRQLIQERGPAGSRDAASESRGFARQEPIELSKGPHIDRPKPCCAGSLDVQLFVITHDDRSRCGHLESFECTMENRGLGFCGADIGAEDDGIE
jgi:hypothetical protein